MTRSGFWLLAVDAREDELSVGGLEVNEEFNGAPARPASGEHKNYTMCHRHSGLQKVVHRAAFRVTYAIILPSGGSVRLEMCDKKYDV